MLVVAVVALETLVTLLELEELVVAVVQTALEQQTLDLVDLEITGMLADMLEGLV